MWIERIELEGFAGITGELVELSEQELNLIIEPNEYGKSTLAECIWATLFDFPDHTSNQRGHEREAFKPWQANTPFRASMDLTYKNRSIRIRRDFASKSLQVLDRSNNQDITSEFLGPSGEDHVGLLVTGMSRDMFRSTCLLGQRHLDTHHAANQLDIAQTFQAMADTASSSSSSASAIEAINEALAKYVFSKGRGSLDAAIKDLEQTKSELDARLQSMNNEHGNVRDWLRQLAELDDRQEEQEQDSPLQADDTAGGSSARSDNAVTEVAAGSDSWRNIEANVIDEFDGWQIELKEAEKEFETTKAAYEQKLLREQELRDLDMQAPVQSSMISALQDLWTRRNSRLQDAERLALDIQPQQEEYERLEQEIAERYQNLENFSADEINSISGLAVAMYKLQQEIQELQKEVQEQTGRHLVKLMQSSQQHGTALDVLKALTRDEIEEAKNYSSLLVVFHEQIQEEQKKLQETKFSLDDIEERRRVKRNSNLGKSIGVFVFALVLFIFLIATHDLPSIPEAVKIACVGLMLISLLVAITIFGMVLPPNYKYYLKDDFESATEQENKHRKALSAAKNKVANLEAKLTALAVKTGTSGKEELLRYISDASSHESVVEEHSSLEQSVETQEARLKKMQKDLSYYFEKAGRDPSVVDSQRAMDLAQDITQMYKEREALDRQFQDIHTSRKQLDFLVVEIEGIDQEIKQRLAQAGIFVPEGVDALAEQINKLLEFSGQRQVVLNELSRLDYELARFDNTYDAIMSMDARINVLKDKIRNMLEEHPALAGLPEQEERGDVKSVIPWGPSSSVAKTKTAAGEQKPAALRPSPAKRNPADIVRREELLVLLRTHLNNRDEHYLEVVEEIARVDHELICARRAKLALELARNVIRTLSSETYQDWSDELNQLSDEIVAELKMDIESLKFDQALHLVVRLRGYDQEFTSHDIHNKLSTGVREQIHWLARIIVSRYLSRHQAMPIILDEPFSEADDSRFLTMMRFLISSVVPHNQIVIMSCHHQRHQWLMSQLTETERQYIAFKRRAGLNSPPGKETAAASQAS